jgi:acetyltransferase-like isoleucine patch superfamily enzyme
MSSIKNVKFLGSFKIIEPVNIYGCILSDNIFVGPFTEIQDKVFIGVNVRIQSHSFICSNTIIGNNCFIGHGVIFSNDKFVNCKVERNSENFLRTELGDNVLVGNNVTFLPVKVCSNVTIGAGSVVTKNIDQPGVYYGNPCKKE